jgi:hypothetical protein
LAGFALPRLQQRHTPLVATLILGVGWEFGTSRCTARPGLWCRWCSPSTTPGCTTRPAASCCASCCMPASPSLGSFAADRRFAAGRRVAAGYVSAWCGRTYRAHPGAARLPGCAGRRGDRRGWGIDALLGRGTLSAAMSVVCRRLQPLEKPMAVHLKSQHRLNVAPGVLHRLSSSGGQGGDFISRRLNCPSSSSVRKSRTGST